MKEIATQQTAQATSEERWLDDWQTRSPLFADLKLMQLHFEPEDEWPSCAELNSVLQLQEFKLVDDHLLASTGLSYEAFIAQTQQIPTRANWHDFFNAIIWHLYPATKRTFNQLHQKDIDDYGVGRTKRRDALTLLDECGVILACTGDEWQRLLHEHRWSDLFWQQGDKWGKQIQPFVIGHALYEQAFNAHEGWCGKALLVKVEPGFFDQSRNLQYAQLDELLAAKLAYLNHPKQLYPLPILGVPGWQPPGIDESYFANPRYFCPAREPSPYLGFES